MNWSDFLPHILPSARGCPDPLAVDHVRKAAREFCARTLVWNYSAVPIESVAGVADYTLQLGAEQELVRLLAVEFDGAVYTVPNGVAGRRAARKGRSGLAIMLNAFDFRLSPTPDRAGLSIITDVAVKPTLDSTSWPDDLAEHVDDLASGAIASLLALPDKQWTSLDTAPAKRAAFVDRMGKVAFKVQRGFGTDSAQPVVRYF